MGMEWLLINKLQILKYQFRWQLAPIKIGTLAGKWTTDGTNSSMVYIAFVGRAAYGLSIGV
jgi:hypothetical protein